MEMPKVGQEWRRKSEPYKVAVVLSVRIDDARRLTGYVTIKTPWTIRGEGGRSLDTFLKQYEKVK